MTTALRLEGVQHQYGVVRALADVDLEVDQGSFTAIFGRNGAGKTTLVSILGGTLRPTLGTVWVWEEPQRSARTFIDKSVVVVPEGRRLFGQLSAKDNIVLGAFPLRESRRRVDERLERVLELFPPSLSARLSVPAAALSGGEQQMVALARAIIIEPRVIVLDEPSLGLAPVIVKSVYRLLRDLNRAGTTVVVVEQGAIALAYATKSIVLDQGAVVHVGDTNDEGSRKAIELAYFGPAEELPEDARLG